MDFELTEAQKRLQEEITSFCLDGHNQEIVSDLLAEGDPYDAHSWLLFRRMAEKGWISLNWPTEYGGLGYTPEEISIFHETMAYYRMPMTGLILTSLVGSVIAYFGSDELKAEFLPRAARGELLFCLLYTEPDAGSDLASLTTRAVEDGDHYIINGVKIFTSLGHEAHYGLLAARTDPDVKKTAGISLFMVPLDAEGVQVNPIYTMGSGQVNEEVFTDVRVHKRFMVGEKNNGWFVLTMALGLERGSISGVAAQGWRYYDELLEEVRASGLDSSALTVQKLARMETELEVSGLLNSRLNSLISCGRIPVAEAAMTKLYSSEAILRMAGDGVDILGLPGLLELNSPEAPLGGFPEYLYQVATMVTVGAGSSEIMRRIIAKSGLGLPV
ncbi:MAG: acyl-CoA dehydrogenase family protein [Actinomycetota bacterium]